jgi:Rrf2 family transcriptional regulator, iron-sulfur cluster assembly transcription factor
MISSSCRYGIRALIFLASRPAGTKMTGLKQIAKDLKLPSPYLAKILQQLAKRKILYSTKGPNGGFSLQRDPKKITLRDIVETIDGDDVFTNCLIHNTSCTCVDEKKEHCPLHDNYASVREDLMNVFSSNSIFDIVKKAGKTEKFFI